MSEDDGVHSTKQIHPSKPPNGFKLNNQGLMVTLKLALIGVVIILMCIPLFLVTGIIEERESYGQTAKATIASGWAGEQTIKGPVLTIPYLIAEKGKDGKIIKLRKYAHFLPDILSIKGKLIPEIRQKGIFSKVVYLSELVLSGDFRLQNQSRNLFKRVDQSDIEYKDAFVSFGVSDLKGLGGEPVFDWNGQKLPIQPGVLTQKIFLTGMHAQTALNQTSQTIPFKLDLKLKGSDSLYFAPLGKRTNVKLSSRWADPSFIGSFLPNRREVKPEGFKADWDISYLARSYSQSWLDDDFDNSNILAMTIDDSRSGISLLQPVDAYRNAVRAAKYGILFISLVFLVFFCFEIIQKLKIHPFQYILVGQAMTIFYLLLLSFSEFIDFLTAYLIASISTTGLIGAYTYSITKSTHKGLWGIMVAVLVGIYAYLYTLLQLQDTSLLIGSIGLFIGLAFLMYITRKIEWYKNHD
ncbi:MAG: cell envelope integrity protein CreD [Candidatus Caenarcaniphilales bacterium]|nr:cell envelope integrity protein CreD [Candidatus Caenarcaniphilales bacterium]